MDPKRLEDFARRRLTFLCKDIYFYTEIIFLVCPCPGVPNGIMHDDRCHADVWVLGAQLRSLLGEVITVIRAIT
ncbi:hypothetical protein KIN20_029679 [Parelaphostrongylus tenuis]|uniref:Uncharacterized protein n=1 Tax=Parelaphostrongylus tenuis TaxID=148309 RepID=A0AAD5R2X1_PARTN|nr:hypothetical protein KIN20_029679 [Parelaphostrongylus tenuis]